MSMTISEIGGQRGAVYSDPPPSKFKVRLNGYLVLWGLGILLVALLHPAIGRTQSPKRVRHLANYVEQATEIGFAVEPRDPRTRLGIEYDLVFRRIPDGRRAEQLVFTKSVYGDWSISAYTFKRTWSEIMEGLKGKSNAKIKESLNQESLVDIHPVELPDGELRDLTDRFASLRVPLLLESGVREDQEMAERFGLERAPAQALVLHATLYEFRYQSFSDSARIQLQGPGKALDGKVHPLVRWIDDAFAIVKKAQKSKETDQQ